MRPVVVLLLLIAVVTAQQHAAFQAKFEKLVTTFLSPNTDKAIDVVAQDMLTQKPIGDLLQHLTEQIIGLVPQSKLESAIGMLTTFQSCLESAGSSLEQAMTAIGNAFQAKLAPVYKKVMTKVKKMRKNKKEDKAILNQAFKIATNGLTKKVVQGVINLCMAKSSKVEFECSVPALKMIMQTAQYNMVYDAKRG
ncbi:hypothetical protein PRIPAC_96437 [Pristionchus pacificus]|uniref:Uncharacterized protein n=1 Tax=Pristionchus pacificus TaxID=54126 RepID=A0A2A6D2R8_PRIPA|nr:hypothetical protein PRIPAC_96437 [Pristionchus pacificus]|eukprot:PDM84636.1 hypothetical protein PRIPAC_33659 [Pristionchus pacificus]